MVFSRGTLPDADVWPCYPEKLWSSARTEKQWYVSSCSSSRCKREQAIPKQKTTLEEDSGSMFCGKTHKITLHINCLKKGLSRMTKSVLLCSIFGFSRMKSHSTASILIQTDSSGSSMQLNSPTNWKNAKR